MGLLKEPLMTVPHFETIHSVDIEIFHQMSEHFDQLVALQENYEDHWRQYDLFSVSFCLKFHGVPWNRF